MGFLGMVSKIKWRVQEKEILYVRIIRLSALDSWFQLSFSTLFSLSLFLGYPFLGESAGWCRKGSPSKQHCRPSERCSGIYPETSCKSFPLTESKLVSFIYVYWFRPVLSYEVTNVDFDRWIIQISLAWKSYILRVARKIILFCRYRRIFRTTDLKGKERSPFKVWSLR